MSTHEGLTTQNCDDSGAVSDSSKRDHPKGCNLCAHWKLALARTPQYRCGNCGAVYARGEDGTDSEK